MSKSQSSNTIKYKSGTLVWMYWPEPGSKKKVYKGQVHKRGPRKGRNKNKIQCNFEAPRKGGKAWSAWIDPHSDSLRVRKKGQRRPTVASFTKNTAKTAKETKATDAPKVNPQPDPKGVKTKTVQEILSAAKKVYKGGPGGNTPVG